MIEALQIALYPLGFISSFFFGSRFLVQWLYSEKKGLSSVPKTFWRLSFFGNLTLALHSLFQMQVHVLIIQMINGAISLRNINLMGEKKTHWPLRLVFAGFTAAFSLSIFTLLYLYVSSESTSFFRIPIAPWTQGVNLNVSWAWHAAGTIGLLLFGSRFFIQWVLSELKQKSFLGKTFFWTSLIGDLLCLAYFIKLGDSVNYIGPIFGLIPYIRNLMLLYRTKEGLNEA